VPCQTSSWQNHMFIVSCCVALPWSRELTGISQCPRFFYTAIQSLLSRSWIQSMNRSKKLQNINLESIEQCNTDIAQQLTPRHWKTVTSTIRSSKIGLHS